MACGLAVAILISVAWIMAQIGAMHLRPAANRIRAMTFGYVLSLPLVFVAYRWLPFPERLLSACRGEAWAMGLLHAYLFHVLLFLLYAECFYHVERAVTLRILIEIMTSPTQPAPLQSVREVYDYAQMVERRLEVLADHDFVEKRGERWHLKPKGRLFASAMRVSSWLFQSRSQRERED